MMFLLIFRDTFKNYEALAKEHTYMSKPKMDQRNKRDLIIILFMLIVWATEEFHGVGGTYVVVISTFLMIPLKLVGKKDIQAINYHLLIFLTAAFSIGPVMTFSGLADIIFSKFTGLFPTSFSLVYAFVILAVAVVLHLILGSNVTTMSVVIPGLMTVSSGIVSPIIVIFLIFVAICGHFILPFHNVLLLLGNGSGYYDNKPVIKYGLFLFPVMLLSVFFIFLPWWQYMSSF
jgi:di/tricarboxylate transporter